MKNIGIAFMVLGILILGFILYKLLGPWLFAILIILGLLRGFKSS